jgi:hypothetical protein
MADHDAWPRAKSQRPEPSWPTVIATTLRLWVDRHPLVGIKKISLRPLAFIAFIATIVIAAATVGIFLAVQTPAPSAARPGAGTSGSGAGGSDAQPADSLQAATVTRNTAAHWIADQVGSGAIVACDPAMCAALQANGLAAARLLMLGTAAADPLGSDLVVATPALRSQFGARLANVYAPEVIASFGSGTGRIDIRAVAPDGTAAYDSALAADRSARIAAGKQLIGNRRITMSAAARETLRAGQVDPRLLAMLAALAAEQPVRILGLGDPSPGASAAIPLRGAEIAPAHAGAHTQARLRSMLSFLQAQRLPFLPKQAVLVHQSALSVQYAAPSPLGLLSGT